jgi:hypothetical protein
MKKAAQQLIGNKTTFAENDVKDLLKIYEIPTTKYKLIQHEKDIKNLDLKYPVALKICTPEILHKTDVGGVILNIKNHQELHNHYKLLRNKFPTQPLLIDEMVETGAEIIIGLIQDPTFGLSIMCGIGGIFTELYKDVTFRVVPIDTYDATQMIEELTGKQLLEGFRHFNATKKPLISLLQKVSKMGEDLIEILDQMDLNPVFIYQNNTCVVDAKLILKKEVKKS